MFSESRKRVKKIGQPPGTAIYTGTKKNIQPHLKVITYSGDDFHQTTGTKLAECLPATLSPGVTWVDVTGLNDVALIEEIAQHFKLHPLTVEDVLNVIQRPKVEEFEGYVFIILKVLDWNEKTSTFTIKQLSLVLGENFVLSFHELETNLFDSILTRLESNPNVG